MRARKELVVELSNLKTKLNCSVICASILYSPFCWKMKDREDKNIVLPLNYTKEQFKKFLEEMTFEYDSGYGTQELFGTVWLTNNVTLEREVFDGSEWWYLNYSDNIPEIPEECFANEARAQ